jgi:pimeloyl-ACP methyl ester carboxylesterase
MTGRRRPGGLTRRRGVGWWRPTVSGTIGTSFATYVEPVTLPGRIDTPTVLSVFAHDLTPEPRSYAEPFLNVREYVAHAAGGHFAAWEQPAAYADDVHRGVRSGG